MGKVLQQFESHLIILVRALGLYMLIMTFGCGTSPKARTADIVEHDPNVERATLVINLTNVPDEAILVASAIFPDKSSFMTEDGASHSGKTMLPDERTGTAQIVLKDVEVGEYGVSVLADRDGDERMTRNFFGLPTEYFGFGNDAKVVLSLPSFESTIIKVHSPRTEIDIRFQSPPTKWGSGAD